MTSKAAARLADVANQLVQDGDLDTAEQILDLTQESGQLPRLARVLYIRAKIQSKRGLPEAARDLLEQAVDIEPDAPEYYEEILRTVPAGVAWQRLSVLQRGLPTHIRDPGWREELAAAYSRTGKPDAAAAELSEVRALHDTADRAFAQGLAHSQAGHKDAAQRAFNDAITLDDRSKEPLGAKNLGIGVFFQKRAEWLPARQAYLQHLQQTGPSAELSFRIGLSHDRAFEWDHAETHYRWAAWLSPKSPRYWYKLGLSLEKQAKWQDAADCYRTGISVPGNKDAPYQSYRAGWCLEQAGEYEAACQYYLRYRSDDDRAAWGISSPPLRVPQSDYAEQLLGPDAPLARSKKSPGPTDFLDPLFWESQAHSAFMSGSYLDAASAYAQAIDRTETHSAKLYFQWGNALYHAGEYEKAAQAFRWSRIYPCPDGLPVKKYYGSTTRARNAKYAEFLETLQIRNSVILYEASHGSQIGCHPLAIFEQIVDTKPFENYLHVWVVDGVDVPIPRQLQSRSNVAVVTIHSDLYLRYLATAKYLVNNSTFLPYFVRRPNQKYLNIWHGTPLKNMGRKNPQSPMSHTNIARNFLHATHIVVPNQHTSGMVLDDNELRGLAPAPVALLGSPRIDRMINASDDSKRDLRKRLTGDPNGRIVLYAPTWKGEIARPRSDAEDIADVLGALDSIDAHILFRAHHFVERAFDKLPLGDRLVPRDIDTYDLLAVTDVLVTDYSSIMFDFLPTGKTIIRHTPDLDEYRAQRGFCLQYDDLPGTETATLEKLKSAVAAALIDEHRPDDRYRHAYQQFCPREDGNASRRVAEFLFDDNQTDVLQHALTSRKVLFRASLIPNGMSASLRNLMQVLPASTETIQPVIVLEQSQIEQSPDRRAEMSKLPPNVRVLGRSGASIFTAEEQWVVQRFMARRKLDSPAQWDILWQAFAREFRRIFGDLQFDASTEFDGYSEWWAAFVSASCQAGRRSIYQHSDMLAEFQLRFPDLDATFELYKHQFDAIVTVSESLMHKNQQALEKFDVPYELYHYAHNLVDVDGLYELRERPIDDDIEEWLRKTSGHLFVAIGRLSVEKNHSLLIRSFARTAGKYPDSRLAIVGGGFLKADLEDLARELDIADRVLIAGHRENPISLLGRADTFVMSSVHEGQPIVLLEALSLGVPIVSTDIPGVRSMLGSPPNGRLVPQAEEPFSEAMAASIRGEIAKPAFSVESYVATALHQFESAVLGVESTRRSGTPHRPAQPGRLTSRLGRASSAIKRTRRIGRRHSE